MDTKLDMVRFEILKNARQAKELAYQALQRAKDEDILKAKALMEESDRMASQAQAAEAELLTFDMTGREYMKEHSRDHILSTLIAKDLVQDYMDECETKLH